MDGARRKDVIRETDAEAIRLARTLVRSARYGALAVLDPADGSPLASRVAVATDLDGTPLILVSALSGHTAGLLADPRCSLLLGEPGKGDPLAHPRISVSCRASRLERGSPEQARVERRYLNRHPKARLYVGFPDFAFFRLDPQKASLNGGFGKAYALTRADLVTDSPANAGLAESEQAAIVHMNEDHRDAVGICARAFAGARGDGWYVIGLDADGMDIGRGDEARRIFFPAPLLSAADLRTTLVELVKAGRSVLAGGA
ncbi:MAG TPA: HugZ family protein [Rhizobiales bacterium]|nr:HugZ family protein [Hyphomicrobiales bacterium]